MTKHTFWLIVLALLLRLILAIFSTGNFDTESYVLVAHILNQGGNVYAETARYNYSPLWFNLINAFSFAGLAFVPVFVRVFLSFVDMVNVVLVWRLSGRLPALLYALSPAAVLITGFQGQFETLSMLPLLLALLTRDKRWTFVLGVLSVIIKHNSLFLVWVLFIHRTGFWRGTWWMAAVGALFIFSFVPYLPDGAEGIVRNVLLYTSTSGTGIGAFLPKSLSLPLFGAVMGANAVFTRHFPLKTALALTICLQMFFMPAIGMQYFLPAILLLFVAGYSGMGLSVSFLGAAFVLLRVSSPVWIATGVAAVLLVVRDADVFRLHQEVTNPAIPR